MAPVTLAETMSPAQHQGWRVLLDLAKVFPAGWCLVGGQMVWLLAAEHGVDPPRATDDVDLVEHVSEALTDLALVRQQRVPRGPVARPGDESISQRRHQRPTRGGRQM